MNMEIEIYNLIGKISSTSSSQESNKLIGIYLDDLMWKNDFQTIDMFINISCKYSLLSIENYMFILMYTLPIKEEISNRDYLYKYIEIRIEDKSELNGLK